jgi:hypothetical protein
MAPWMVLATDAYIPSQEWRLEEGASVAFAEAEVFYEGDREGAVDELIKRGGGDLTRRYFNAPQNQSRLRFMSLRLMAEWPRGWTRRRPWILNERAESADLEAIRISSPFDR